MTDAYLGQTISQVPEFPHELVGIEQIPIARTW